MINQTRINRFIQLLEAKGVLAGTINAEQECIEISVKNDGRIIARRSLSDFDDTNIDLITLIPS